MGGGGISTGSFKWPNEKIGVMVLELSSDYMFLSIEIITVYCEQSLFR